MSKAKPFDIDVKRFYVPGHKLRAKCPKCKRNVVHDLEDSYLSYPTANEAFDFYFYCKCGHEFTRRALLTVSIELLPAVRG